MEADTLMNRQDYTGAIKLLDKIIGATKLATDDDYNALYNRALSYFSLGRYDEALKDINQYIAKFPEQHALMLRLYIYQEKGESANLLEDINKLVESNPENPELLSWRIGAFLNEGKYPEARRDIRALMKLDKTAELTLSLGLSYYYEDKPDSALIYFDQMIKEDPTAIEGYLYAGSLCIEHEAYEMAVQYLNKGLQKHPTDNVLLYYKGVALVELDRAKEGCRCLTKAFNNGFDDAVDYIKEYCYGIDD